MFLKQSARRSAADHIRIHAVLSLVRPSVRPSVCFMQLHCLSKLSTLVDLYALLSCAMSHCSSGLPVCCAVTVDIIISWSWVELGPVCGHALERAPERARLSVSLETQADGHSSPVDVQWEMTRLSVNHGRRHALMCTYKCGFAGYEYIAEVWRLYHKNCIDLVKQARTYVAFSPSHRAIVPCSGAASINEHFRGV